MGHKTAKTVIKEVVVGQRRVGDPKLLVVRPAPGIVLVSLEMIAAEMQFTREGTVKVLEMLEVPILEMHGQRYVNLHAWWKALHQASDPSTPIDCMTDVAVLWGDLKRAEFLKLAGEVRDALMLGRLKGVRKWRNGKTKRPSQQVKGPKRSKRNKGVKES